jgi:2-keto-3-deoxy-L-fuconate dehydrogenase
MTDRVSDKSILVTAAGQGIGRAAALALANEGARVLATDLDSQTVQALAEEQGNIEGQKLDVRDADAVAKIVDARGPFDVLVNCAGVVHDGSVLDCTDAEWDLAFDLNAKAMFRLIRAVLPGMLDKKGGSIINISSVASSLKGVPRRCAYGASKAAVIGLTKSIAADFVASGIRCNAICPGTVESPSLRQRLEATGDVEQARKAFIARQPMGRFGKADEIAAVIVHLASDESAFTSGQALAVDGGWTI